jgi:hypothetical protein
VLLCAFNEDSRRALEAALAERRRR